MSSKTSAPTGLKVSRSGDNFKFEWTQKADYDKQQIMASYTLKGTNSSTSAFSAWTDISKNAKAKTIKINVGNNKLLNFVFKVRGKVNKKDWSSATSINVSSKIDVPHTPTASMALTSRYASTFTWSTKTDKTSFRMFDHVVRQTRLIKDCTVASKDGFEKLTGAWTTDGSDLGASGSKAYPETSGTIAGKSYTRVVRVKAKGAGGESGWNYAWHVYAAPYAATNVRATATKDLAKNTFQGYATWTGTRDAAHPIDSVIPQYVMAIPDEGMQCPDVSWTSLPEQRDTTKDATAFTIDNLLTKDQCLFFRVLHKHDNEEVPSLPVLVDKDGTGFLKDPEFTRSADKQSTSARVYAKNHSEVPDSFLVITYQDDNHEEYAIGIIQGENDYTDVVYPADSSNPKFGVYAVVATATYEQREDGGDQYRISSVRMKSENTLYESGTVVKVPQILELKQTNKNAVFISWEWVWEGIEGIEISWSENEEAWESNEEPETYNVKKINPNRLYLLGLDTGKRWYIRARFIKSEEDESYGNYTETKWIDLVTAPAVPDLELSEPSVKEGGEFTASWVYVSTDDQEQKAAVIYEVPDDAESEEDYIKVAEAQGEQSTIISLTDNKIAQTWSTGTSHNLVVQVISENDTPSEFSAIKTIKVADPITCTIEETSLVPYVEEFGAEDYAGGDMITNEGDITIGHAVINLMYDAGGYTGAVLTVTGDTTGTYSASWGKIYGGSYDFITGELISLFDANGNELAEPVVTQLTAQGITLNTGDSVLDSNVGTLNVHTYTDSNTLYALAELPLTVTVTGAGDQGDTTLVIERAEPYREESPDGNTYLGFDGEAVYQDNYTGESQQRITRESLIGKFNDGVKYRVHATIKDALGQTSEDEVEFIVAWKEQASEPTITVEPVDDTARITVQKSADANNDDYCNIYRFSAGKPELIVEHGDFNTTYVDPYPTIGDYGYRAVLFTANGDYIIDATAEHGKKFAWADTDFTYQSNAQTLIDFGDDRVSLNKNVDVSSTWAKDFQQTKYLGGSVQGDWNAGVTRSSSISAVALTLTDMSEIESMERLAEYTGQCHIRTKSGDNYHADIQVSVDNSHDKAGFVRSYSLTINKIDSQALDGLTEEEWEGLNDAVE